MAMDAYDCPVDVRNFRADSVNQCAELVRGCIAHCVGDIDDRGTGIDGPLQDFQEKGRVSP